MGGKTWAILLGCSAFILSPAFLRSNTLFQPVAFNQFYWLVSTYFIAAKEQYLVRDTMKKLGHKLDPSKFKRIHRSHIVNVDFIKEMQSWSHGDYIVILKEGTKLTLNRRYRDCLFERQLVLISNSV